jgi:2-polyprenyl-6-methoxyphenol hydroxylase-like FAD-dependent oxidoreductase
MSSSKNAIIIGGSLGGLLTGVVLKRLGHRVTIFERSPIPLLQDQGAGIVAGGDTLTFLKQFDRIQKDVAVISPMRHYLNIKGEEINREEWEQKMTRHVPESRWRVSNCSWDLIYHVLRANFDGVSSDYVDAPEDAGQAKYEYGFNVTGVKYDERSEEVVVSFTDRDKNERNERTDRVFAADGPSSTIRGLLVPSVKREYAGYVFS